MKAKIAKIAYPYISFPDRLIITLGISSGILTEMEAIEMVVVINKPESELRRLSFTEIERLAEERAVALLQAVE